MWMLPPLSDPDQGCSYQTCGLLRLRDMPAAFKFNTEYLTQTQKQSGRDRTDMSGYTGCPSQGLPSAPLSERTHVKQIQKAESPSYSQATTDSSSLIHTLNTVQIHRHMHVFRFCEYWHNPLPIQHWCLDPELSYPRHGSSTCHLVHYTIAPLTLILHAYHIYKSPWA